MYICHKNYVYIYIVKPENGSPKLTLGNPNEDLSSVEAVLWTIWVLGSAGRVREGDGNPGVGSFFGMIVGGAVGLGFSGADFERKAAQNCAKAANWFAFNLGSFAFYRNRRNISRFERSATDPSVRNFKLFHSHVKMILPKKKTKKFSLYPKYSKFS